MATPEAGTKRICQETGKKFYDLNKDPIVSPYTGISYPLSFFENEKLEAIKHRMKAKASDKLDDDEEDEDEEDEDAVEIVTLEEADAEVSGDTDVPDLDDDDDDIDLEDDDDAFLEDDEDEDDVSDLIVDAGDDDKDI